MCIKHANCAPCSRSRACTNTPYLLPFVIVVTAAVAAAAVVYFTTSLFAFDKFLKIFQQQQQQQHRWQQLPHVCSASTRYLFYISGKIDDHKTHAERAKKTLIERERYREEDRQQQDAVKHPAACVCVWAKVKAKIKTRKTSMQRVCEAGGRLYGCKTRGTRQRSFSF